MIASRIWPLFLAALVLAGCPKSPRSAPDAGLAAASPAWLEGTLPRESFEGPRLDGGTLVVRLATEPAGLNPLHDAYRDGWLLRTMTGTVYETLFEVDRDTHPVYSLKPQLAERVEESPDRLTQTFHLRRGVKFHDGSTFSSADVAAVMTRVLSEQDPTTKLRSAFQDVAGFEAPDEHTFVLRWKKPYYLGLRQFAAGVPMFSAASLKGPLDGLAINRSPIGTGPFRFEAWETGKQFSLKRHDAYWGPKPALDRIVYRIVKDHTVATQLFERGEFDLMTQIQPTVWRGMEKPQPEHDWAKRHYHRVRFEENNYSFIGWNEERPYFKDRRVRVALGMLFPYTQVGRAVDHGLEARVTCPYYANSHFCDPDVKPLQYDPKAAAALLDEAGWKDSNGDGVRDRDGVPLKFSLLVSAHSVRLSMIAPILQSELQKVGIDLSIERIEWSAFLTRLLAHDFDAASLAWSQLDVEQDLFETFHSSQSKGSNYVSYGNPEVDQLLVAARGELDPAKRVALSRRIHRLVYEDQVYLFISSRPMLDAVKRHVRGLKPSLAWYDLRRVALAPKP